MIRANIQPKKTANFNAVVGSVVGRHQKLFLNQAMTPFFRQVMGMLSPPYWDFGDFYPVSGVFPVARDGTGKTPFPLGRRRSASRRQRVGCVRWDCGNERGQFVNHAGEMTFSLSVPGMIHAKDGHWFRIWTCWINLPHQIGRILLKNKEK